MKHLTQLAGRTPRLFTIAGLLAGLAGATTLLLAEEFNTQYEKGHVFAVSLTSTIAAETTNSEILRDGEPMNRGGRGGGERTTTFELEYTDTVLAAANGSPSQVKRTFDAVSGETAMEGRDGPVERAMDSAFEGLTLVLSLGDDETVQVEVEDGDAPDAERLEGHSLQLPLDGLLSGEDVAAGTEWEIDGATLMAAMGMGMQRKLVDRPERENAGGGRGGRGGGRGGRGGMWRGGGGGGAEMLAGGTWEVLATLADETRDVDGVECAVITITAEVEGTPERPEREGMTVDSSYSGEFEGELLWSREEARPVRFEIQGTYELNTEMSMESERGSMEISRTEESTVEVRVDITKEAAGE